MSQLIDCEICGRPNRGAWCAHCHGLIEPVINPPRVKFPTPALNCGQRANFWLDEDEGGYHARLRITREEMSVAPLDWVDSMRARLAREHGVPVEQVWFNQMSYADPAFYGEFVVRKIESASPAV